MGTLGAGLPSMGILDDAIREHLDLKRLHGAEDDEVRRLEDEAFGPPTRPGEPDFPDSQEQPALEGGAGDGAETGEHPSAGESASEEATALLDREPAKEPPADAPPADPSLEVETPPPPSSVDPEATEPEGEMAFFDQELETDLTLDDLDLRDEEEPEPVSEALPPEPDSREQPPEPASEEMEAEPVSEEHPVEPASEEHPVAGLETVEHPMEELLADDAEAPATGEEDAVEPVEGDEDEDVLEETPEFLRDQPEDDELWFEQGEPKDFDF
jgi:hypothetical protein